MWRDLLRWARITSAGSDDEQFHTQQIEYLGKTANAVMVFPYGLHANCTPDSLAALFSMQCNPENKAAIAWKPKDRPKMASGEVVLYHPDTNSIISWRQGGNLEIRTDANIDATCADATVTCDNLTVTASNNVTVTTSNDVTVSASNNVNITTTTLTLDGDLVVNGTMTNNGKDVGDTHSHSQGNDSDGNTEQNINGVL